MKARILVSASLCLLLGCMAGCIGVDSKHPLSDPAQAKLDTRLNGHWVQMSDKVKIEYTMVVAGDDAPKGLYKLTMKIGDDVASTYCFTTKLGEDHYLNLANFKTDDPPKKWDAKQVTFYSILGYRVVKENELELLPSDEKFFQKLVEKGELKQRDSGVDLDDLLKDLEEGTPAESSDESSGDFELSSDTETLANVFTKYPKQIRSGKPMKITRVGKAAKDASSGK